MVMSRQRSVFFAFGCAVFAVLTAGCSAPAGPHEEVARSQEKIIFGIDDRTEPFALVPESLEADIANASVALMDVSNLDTTDPSNVRVVAKTQVQRFGVCVDERFSSQPSAANCSGTLLAPDLVLTAGHCVDAVTCAGSLRVVFGYRMKDDASLAPMTSDGVFSCSRVVAQEFTPSIDYALIRLDRPVPGAVLPKVKVGPLALTLGQHLVVAGYPEGMPEKVAGGATVHDSRPTTADFFTSDLDSFPGDSGGGVFVVETGELAGVLVRGPNPGYVVAPGESCARPEHADAEAAGTTLIGSTYVHHAIDALCAAEPDPRLCSCGNGACEPTLGETTATCPADCGSRCGDGACNGAETGNGCYVDCGSCGNASCELEEIARMSCPSDCGCPPGLTSLNGGACVPRRGNVNGDDVVDVQDVVALRAAVAHPQTSFIHTFAADVDCSGAVDERDAVDLDLFVRGRTRHLACDRMLDVSAGFQHTCALTASGRVRCWGDDSLGQLGLGPAFLTAPVGRAGDYPVVDLGHAASQISAGATHTCALLTDGSVTCWGDGSDGSLGFGSLANVGDTGVPRSVGAVALGGRAVAVAAGGRHSCAVLDGGSVRCWGANDLGQLGYGTPEAIGDNELPTAVAPLHFPEPVAQLALGFDHSCALTVTGAVYCWGDNFLGQLGRGTLDGGGPLERADLTQPVSLGGRARSIAAGIFTTCAVREDGVALCWGDNSSGQLGNGNYDTIGDDEQPVIGGAVVGGAGVTRIVLGLGQTCALFRDQSVKCWGSNQSGQLGYGTADPLAITPAALSAVPIGAPVQAISLSSGHTCVVLPEGALRCWGDGTSGKLGYGIANSLGGADATAQLAGDVPFEPFAASGWVYREPDDTELWLDDGVPDDDGEPAAAVANRFELALVHPKAMTMPGIRIYYDFFRSHDAPGSLTVDSRASSGWSSSLVSSGGGFFSAVLAADSAAQPDAADGKLGVVRAEVRLIATGSTLRWNWQDNYSEADRPVDRKWLRTRRVQVVDSASTVIVGWARP